MKSRAYDAGSRAADFHGGTTAEIHFDDGRVVQVSAASAGRVLIRMWGAGGLMEYGYKIEGFPGNAMPLFSALVKLTDVAVIESLNARGTR